MAHIHEIVCFGVLDVFIEWVDSGGPGVCNLCNGFSNTYLVLPKYLIVTVLNIGIFPSHKIFLRMAALILFKINRYTRQKPAKTSHVTGRTAQCLQKFVP